MKPAHDEHTARRLAFAAATDAANRQMRTAGRRAWNADDMALAIAELDRLWAASGYAPDGWPARQTP